MRQKKHKQSQAFSSDSLEYFIDTYHNHDSLRDIVKRYKKLVPFIKEPNYPTKLDKLIKLYADAISPIEDILWANGGIQAELKHYQKLFQELECLHINRPTQPRHDIIIVIPVADRPEHLKQCLQSLLNLCSLYNYGGFKNEKYTKVKALISDDSKQINNQHINKQLAESFTQKGLDVEYFGINEQLSTINSLKITTDTLHNIVGNIDKADFSHKGASITRNITYLKLNEMQRTDNPSLCYFIDSDQEFQIKVKSDGLEHDIYAVNYFYYLDKIFTEHPIDILTGKVVGDPPVSPSVMIGNFLSDLIEFIAQISKSEKTGTCDFHNHQPDQLDDAAYHDMADLFGFKVSNKSHQYHCMIKGTHDNADCLIELSARLNQFFDGVHPTRKSYYLHEDALSSITPARTIYTGNYVFNASGLRHFIPFANLKLRMAGPVLGRLIKADIANRFVSANLPMLHKRTVNTKQQSEFRPGVVRDHKKIDLSGEFMRQFYGDVMLFSIEALIEYGFPDTPITQTKTSDIVTNTISDMKLKYIAKHEENIHKIKLLKSLVTSPGNWWHNNTELQPALLNIHTFIQNIESNFGSEAKVYSAIFSNETVEEFHKNITQALLTYKMDKKCWSDLLDEVYQ